MLIDFGDLAAAVPLHSPQPKLLARSQDAHRPELLANGIGRSFRQARRAQGADVTARRPRLLRLLKDEFVTLDFPPAAFRPG